MYCTYQINWKLSVVSEWIYLVLRRRNEDDSRNTLYRDAAATVECSVLTLGLALGGTEEGNDLVNFITSMTKLQEHPSVKVVSKAICYTEF